MYVKKQNEEKIVEFLKNSNDIEREYSYIALEDSLKAWNFAFRNKNRIKGIDMLYMKSIHKLLMKNIRPDINGKLRTCSVSISGNIKYFEGIDKIEEDLDKYFFLYNKIIYEEKDNLEEITELMHIMFEEIHPFEDGNGRVGRILWNIQRLMLGLPLKIIHTGKEQFDYYKIFNNIYSMKLKEKINKNYLKKV